MPCPNEHFNEIRRIFLLLQDYRLTPAEFKAQQRAENNLKQMEKLITKRLKTDKCKANPTN
jgi:hypothetical protein